MTPCSLVLSLSKSSFFSSAVVRVSKVVAHHSLHNEGIYKWVNSAPIFLDRNYFELLMVLSSLQKSAFLKLTILFAQYFWCQNWDQWHKLSGKHIHIFFSTFGWKINEFRRKKLEKHEKIQKPKEFFVMRHNIGHSSCCFGWFFCFCLQGSHTVPQLLDVARHILYWGWNRFYGVFRQCSVTSYGNLSCQVSMEGYKIKYIFGKYYLKVRWSQNVFMKSYIFQNTIEKIW